MPCETGWDTKERPGYLGKKRNEIQRLWTERYGEGNWRIAWQWGKFVVSRAEALQFYEDGYYEYLKSNQEVLHWLTSTASGVYDTAPSNIEAGFSYDVQETPNNHIHDVAIRRAVLRNGIWFNGDHLMQVRGPKTEGERLSPHLIPFHLPHMIVPGDIGDYAGKGKWWRELGIENSVEEFYQQNKVLQTKWAVNYSSD